MSTITRTIREQVRNQLRDEVLAGRFPAGEPLREEELAERYGVSRGPIRDAFLQLSQEGLLAYQANRGVKVRNPPDTKNRDFIVSLRQQIECFAVRDGLNNVTEEQIAEVHEHLDALRKACDAKDVTQIAKADIQFHEAILIACGGENFLPIWTWLCSQMLLTYSRLENFEDIHAEHVEIMSAFAAKKKTLLVTALKANIC